VVRVCCALVNFDLRPEGGSPLRPTEGEFLRKYHTARAPAGLRGRWSRRDGEDVGREGEIAQAGGQGEEEE
jgi:hypothetical protein